MNINEDIPQLILIKIFLKIKRLGKKDVINSRCPQTPTTHPTKFISIKCKKQIKIPKYYYVYKLKFRKMKRRHFFPLPHPVRFSNRRQR